MPTLEDVYDKHALRMASLAIVLIGGRQFGLVIWTHTCYSVRTPLRQSPSVGNSVSERVCFANPNVAGPVQVDVQRDICTVLREVWQGPRVVMSWSRIRQELVTIVFVKRACEQLVIDAEDPILTTQIRQLWVSSTLVKSPFLSKVLVNPSPR